MNNRLTYQLLVAFSAAFTCLTTVAGELSVTNATVRAMPPGQTTTAAYLSVTNGGDKACLLVGGRTAIAGKVEIHQHQHSDGMMKMRPVASLAVEPDETLVFQPGGYHLMLFDLQAPLMPGETHSITLLSENCGEALVTAEVHSLLQKSAPITPMKHHAGHNMHSGHSTGDRK